MATGTSGDGTVTIDHRSGRFSLQTAVTPTTTGDIVADYKPTTGDPGNRATATIGSGADGSVQVVVDALSANGNNWTIRPLH